MGMTINIQEEIDRMMTDEIMQEERKLFLLDANEIVDYVRDYKNTITEDFVIRRFIMKNLSEKLMPEDFQFNSDSNEAWPDEVVKYVASNLKKLEKEKGIINDNKIISIAWESFLKPVFIENEEKNTVLYGEHQLRTKETVYNIAFTLGMDEKETAKLLCAWGGRSYNFHDPIDLAAFFCLSDKALRNYVVYKEVKDSLVKIFNETVVDLKEENSNKFFGRLINGGATQIALRYKSNLDFSQMNNEEKIKAFENDIQKNVKELKGYTASNTNRNIVKLILDDLKVVYSDYYFSKSFVIKNDEEVIEDVNDEDKESLAFTKLMNEIQKYYLVKIRGKSNYRGASLDLPSSIEGAINQLQTDLYYISNDFIRKENRSKSENRKYEVKRRDVMMLVFLLLQEYIFKVELLYEYNKNKGTITPKKIDEEIPAPITLMSDFSENGDTSLLRDAQSLAYDIYENGFNQNEEINQKKMDLFIKVVNHYMEAMNFVPFYVPNALDKFLLLVFMTDDPITKLGDITEEYSNEGDI